LRGHAQVSFKRRKMNVRELMSERAQLVRSGEKSYPFKSPSHQDFKCHKINYGLCLFRTTQGEPAFERGRINDCRSAIGWSPCSNADRTSIAGPANNIARQMRQAGLRDVHKVRNMQGIFLDRSISIRHLSFIGGSDGRRYSASLHMPRSTKRGTIQPHTSCSLTSEQNARLPRMTLLTISTKSSTNMRPASLSISAHERPNKSHSLQRRRC
jgi:hypothetical protein